MVAACLIGVPLGGGDLHAAAPQPEAPVAPEEPVPAPPQRVVFASTVANVELAALELYGETPASVTRAPQAAGSLWWGRIMRRLPGDGPESSDHYVRFAAEYVDGAPHHAWCDVNANGDLTDDAPMRFSAYPAPEGARSFLVRLGWTARHGGRAFPIDRTLRIVLEPAVPPGFPVYRVQAVHAMTGEVALQGRTHRAFLFDGNGDGLYTADFYDGLFVDLDDDRHFDIDPMLPGFGPLAVPFPMGPRTYRVVSVEPDGTALSLAEIGPADVVAAPVVGQPAPDFSFRDPEGRQVRLAQHRGRYAVVYFWASWCGKCTEQAPGLRAFYDRFRPRGVEILAVSYDTDRARFDAFRRTHGQSWPSSYSGRMLWEDPIGRLYQARWPGAAYLIDPQGRLEGIYDDASVLAARLGELMPDRPAPASR